MIEINFIAVILAALLAFVIGFLLHGPVSGKLWMKLADIHPTGNEKFSDMIPQMLWNLLANLVTAGAIALLFNLIFTSSTTGDASALHGAITALWFWLGFNVTSTSMDTIWMGKNYRLWLFECFCSFVMYAAMGAVIGGM